MITGGTTLNWFTFANLHHPVWDLDFSLKALPTLDFWQAEFTGTLATRFDLGKGFI